MTLEALPEAGDLLAGRYEIRGDAGEGGFATVFRARNVETDETVAVKFPNYASSNDEAVVEEYFRKEADALDRISAAGGHANVMALRERGEVDGSPMLVVEFVEGYELDEAVDRVGPFDGGEVRGVGIDLCEAMSFLHENEIVYRDLKPDNVMLTQRDGDVKPTLIDFNTATGFESGRADDGDTTILGPYKPPEVADARRSDARQGPWSDVYSVGKILMFMLKGTVPKMDGVDPRDFGADCPDYLAEIVEKATRPDHEGRYRNATVMEQVLADRDSSPPPQATVSYLQGDREFTVHPGDTIGRRYAEGPSPSIAIEDDREYISTVQIGFEIEDGTWRLRDRSLNGTYVQPGEGWQRVLSAVGRERLREHGEDPADRHGRIPPETYPLSEGDLIALVHPSYGKTFEFHPQ